MLRCAVLLQDSVDSVILLDSMSSEEDTLENNDVTQEMEAKDRTEWLMSMAEYRDEIYQYLRKSEVPVPYVIVCLKLLKVLTLKLLLIFLSNF